MKISVCMTMKIKLKSFFCCVQLTDIENEARTDVLIQK